MGLTIHYTLSLPAGTTIPDVRQKLTALRQSCLDLPFAEVGELKEFKGEDCDFSKRDQEDPVRWFLCQADAHISFKFDRAGKPVVVKLGEDGSYGINIVPEQIIGFRTYPGDGCEDANVGLSRFPKSVIVQNDRTGKRHRLAVAGNDGWQWSSFCKTQYANEHGVENFLRCHLGVIAMLDTAKALGFEVQVNDEGKFWESRNLETLVREIGSWDQMIAGFGGALKDVAEGAGMTLEAPIFDRKDFEKLEMEGQSQLPAGFGEVVRGLVKETAKIKSKMEGN